MGMRLVRIALLVMLAIPAHADERTNAAVAHIGPRTITVGDVEDRLAKLSPVQRSMYGSTPEAIRKKYLEDVVIPETLYELGAESRKLATQYPTSYEADRTKADATLRALHVQVGTAASIPEADVHKYYDEHRLVYDAPDRINVWRILVKTKEEADGVLADAKKDLTVQHWNQLARDKSLDKTTSMRGGNVGFIGSDGSSNETGVKVDPAIVLAVKGVKDGELVPAPVAEAEGFDVVWRRGTVAAAHRTFEDSQAQIRDTLHKQRVEAEMKKLTDKLKADKVKDFTPDILDTVDLAPPNGTIVPKKRPGQVPPIGTPSSSAH
jgi:peptidyl-prolyl cis-trans isomerase C